MESAINVLAFCGGVSMVLIAFGIFVRLCAKTATYTPADNYRNRTRVPTDPPMWTYSKVTTKYAPPAPAATETTDEQKPE